MIRTKWVLTVYLTLLSSFVFAQEDRLVLISPHWEGIRIEFERAFRDHYQKTFNRSIRLQWIDVGGTLAVLRFLRTSFAKNPKGIGIDLVWGGGMDPYLQLKREGILQPLRIAPKVLRSLPTTASGVPLYDRDGFWYASALSGFGILYNKRLLQLLKARPPLVWEDLADGALSGWVEVPDPRRSGSAHMMCEIILQAYGWEKGWQVLTALFANSKRVTAGSEDVVTDVSTGEVACGPSIDFYAWAKIAEVGKETLGFVYPKGLTVINPDGIGCLKGAPHLVPARAFVEFVLSEKGQRLWMLPMGHRDGPKQFTLARMSILPQLYEKLGDDSVITVNPFQFRPGLRYDGKKGETRMDILNSLLGALLVTNHRELRQAWSALLKRGLSGPQAAKILCRVPLSEKEALERAPSWATDRRTATALETKWTAEARERYRHIKG
ncbi:MAG: extracellular solute-binding protein [Armatimonadetes bacterium]|nr:extracellular solute-binding protein [Armatimonadota bacterium]MDW8121331.1 extracellular solute-binding protein [Armatimonadota bacterium]